MKVSIDYAAEHFEDLVAAVQNGESVEIECAGEPAVRLVAFNAAQPALKVGERILGAGTAVGRLPTSEELEQIDREWKHEIEEKAIGVHDE